MLFHEGSHNPHLVRVFLGLSPNPWVCHLLVFLMLFMLMGMIHRKKHNSSDLIDTYQVVLQKIHNIGWVNFIYKFHGHHKNISVAFSQTLMVRWLTLWF